jgi:hypothetical protein
LAFQQLIFFRRRNPLMGIGIVASTQLLRLCSLAKGTFFACLKVNSKGKSGKRDDDEDAVTTTAWPFSFSSQISFKSHVAWLGCGEIRYFHVLLKIDKKSTSC